jgi:hypothetical protein
MDDEPKNQDIELLRLEFEREKWREDTDARRHELSLRDREQANRDAEIDLKRQEQAGSKWRSPLIVAILAAAVAGFGNAGVTALNGWLQRDLENRKRNAEFQLEQSKAESSRILEMIKTGDSEKAAHNLAFLLDTGLVSGDQSRELRTFLENRKPGTGPSLPAPASKPWFEIQPTQSLTEAIRQSLEKNLEAYIAYLETVQLRADSKKVAIKIDKMDGNILTAYSRDANEVTVDPTAVDRLVPILAMYTNHVLTSLNSSAFSGGGHEDSRGRTQPLTIMPALAAYFACNFVVKSTSLAIEDKDKSYCESLKNNRKFTEFERTRNDKFPEDATRIWTGLFSELRSLIGSDMDLLLSRCWSSIKWPNTSSNWDLAKSFNDTLINTATQTAPHHVGTVRASLQKREFPFSLGR